jgi:plastocyanin
MKETAFYVIGIVLAISAVVISFIGLKAEKFPGKLSALVIVWFGALAIGAATFAVLYSQEHAEHRAHANEHANEVYEAESGSEPFEEEEEAQKEAKDEGGSEDEGSSKDDKGEEQAGGGETGGAGGTLMVTADESALQYAESSLETEAGEVEVDFDNPSSIPHDVATEQGGEQLAATEVIANAKDSTTIELKKGEYVFFCTVPGHREAGMEGPLTVR